MKLSPLMQVKAAAALGMALFLLGCEAPETEASEQSPPVYPAVYPAAQPDLVTVTTNLPPEPAELLEADQMIGAPTNAVPVQLSERLQEVVRLAQSSVGDEVILAFIQSSPTPFSPTPDEIVYLTDVGLSDVIITALVNHRGTQPQVAQQPAQPLPAQPQPAPGPVVAQGEPASGPMPEATYNPEPQVVYSSPPVVQYVEPAPAVEYSYFYSSLSPYGSWMDVPNYGWCWQPSVAVMHRGWRPYFDRGRWLDSDAGFYWHSDYSWGWAPFHYGRWFNHPMRGWCWTPGSVWAPSWVSWRYTDSHCGWAPLPPGAHYRPGFGFSYYGAHVGLSFGFGLHHDAWNFVPAHRFHDREVWRHGARPNERLTNFRRSKVINNYTVVNNTIVNRGVGRDRLPAMGRGEGRKVAIRDLPESRGNSVRPDRLHREGSEVVVYRPKPIETAQRGVRSFDSSPVRAVPGGRPGAGEAEVRGSSGGPAQARPTVQGRFEPRPVVNGGRPGSPGQSLDQAGTARPGNAQTRPQSSQGPTAPVVSGRSEPVRSWPATGQSVRPATTAPSSPVIRQERPSPSQTVTPSRRSAEPQPSRAPASQSSASALFQRPSSAAPQAVAPPTIASRQEPSKPAGTAPAPVARYNYSAPASSYQPPVQRNFPVQGPSFSLPQQSRPAPSYSAPALQPRPSYSAPAIQSRPAPSFSAPAVQSRPAPSYSAPVQSRPSPSFSLPPTRSAPQSAPAPSPAQRSNGRRQN